MNAAPRRPPAAARRHRYDASRSPTVTDASRTAPKRIVSSLVHESRITHAAHESPRVARLRASLVGARPRRHVPRAMTSRTLYDVLGVSPSASSSEIKRAYLDLARVYHPDVSSSSPREDDDTFAKISHAYDVLKNPVSRRAYDAVALAATTRRSSAASSRAWSPANANWRRRPGFENSYAFDDDDDDDDGADASGREGASAVHERRAEAERARARAKADAARWWKHERAAAERRRRAFAESAAAKTARRGERFTEATRALWQTRAGVVWQDAVVMAIGVGVACFAATRAMRAIGGREPPPRDASPPSRTTAAPRSSSNRSE